VQINTGTLPDLSTQQVTSCTPNPTHCGGTGGCYGSVCQLGFNYIQLFGIVSGEDYPYTSGTTMATGECQYDLSAMTPIASITGYNTLPTNDQDAVLNHLANVGPLAIAADASVWHRYSGGVFDDCSYDENISINHGIQLVGYGTDEVDGDYWKVRNSWGPGWGENGYIRLKRDQKAQCGVNSTPMDGTACVGGPGNDQQTVCGQCGMLLDVSYPIGAHLVKN
jgi:cathepsin L